MGMKYLAFDVETPNRKNDRICSIGLSLIDERGNIQTEELLVNPETEFDSFNIELTGISPETVAGAPAFPAVWNKIEPWFCNYTILAHNAHFDLSVLHKTLSAYNLTSPTINYICTMRMAQQILPCAENYKLNTLCNEYEIPLMHHRAGSDSYGCARLFMEMERLVDDTDCYKKSYDLNGIWHEKQGGFGSRHTSQNTLLLKELSSVLKVISCDGILAEEELSFLINWINENASLRGNYPYDRIYAKLTEVLKDGVVTDDEKEELLYLFHVIDDPIKAASENIGHILIRGKSVCLSGEFDYGTKEQVSEMLTEKGAVIQSSVNKKTDILVVGGQGNSAWCSGNYGTKVKKAMELKEKGVDIQIVKEKDFFEMI